MCLVFLKPVKNFYLWKTKPDKDGGGEKREHPMQNERSLAGHRITPCSSDAVLNTPPHPHSTFLPVICAALCILGYNIYWHCLKAHQLSYTYSNIKYANKQNTSGTTFKGRAIYHSTLDELEII